MAKSVRPVPEGHHTVTPYLVLDNAAAAIEFYKKAFGANEICRMCGPDGHGVVHAELKIGDSFLYLSDEFPGACGKSPKTLGGCTAGLSLYVEDCDALFNQAVAAGATPSMPPADMFWGDRFSKVIDPFGHEWSIGTHIEDVPMEEMHRRSQAYFAQMAAQAASASA